jgi:hypothetical protein
MSSIACKDMTETVKKFARYFKHDWTVKTKTELPLFSLP